VKNIGKKMNEQVSETEDKASNHPFPVFTDLLTFDLYNRCNSHSGPDDIQKIESYAIDPSAC
jgi:hypothetical protein